MSQKILVCVHALCWGAVYTVLRFSGRHTVSRSGITLWMKSLPAWLGAYATLAARNVAEFDRQHPDDIPLQYIYEARVKLILRRDRKKLRVSKADIPVSMREVLVSHGVLHKYRGWLTDEGFIERMFNVSSKLNKSGENSKSGGGVILNFLIANPSWFLPLTWDEEEKEVDTAAKDDNACNDTFTAADTDSTALRAAIPGLSPENGVWARENRKYILCIMGYAWGCQATTEILRKVRIVGDFDRWSIKNIKTNFVEWCRSQSDKMIKARAIIDSCLPDHLPVALALRARAAFEIHISDLREIKKGSEQPLFFCQKNNLSDRGELRDFVTARLREWGMEESLWTEKLEQFSAVHRSARSATKPTGNLNREHLMTILETGWL